VSPGKIIPRGSLAIGLPARVSRELEEAEIARIRENAAEYLKLAESYRTM
jgi:carbonic anhydrase/acetyltransferase-like protein (isoleucine patch superfamily)